jgi:hypothetical protein
MKIGLVFFLFLLAPSLRAETEFPPFAVQWTSEQIEMAKIDPSFLGNPDLIKPTAAKGKRKKSDYDPSQKIPLLHDSNLFAQVQLVPVAKNSSLYSLKVVVGGDNESRSDYQAYEIPTLKMDVDGVSQPILIERMKKAKLDLATQELTLIAEIPRILQPVSTSRAVKLPKNPLCEIKINFEMGIRGATLVHFQYLKEHYQLSYATEKKLGTHN